MKKIMSICFVAFLFVGIVGCAQTPETPDHDAMLADLGVNTQLGDRKDPNGNSLSESYNPFGKKIGTLFKQCEIYTAGAGVNGKNQALFDDGTKNYAMLFQETNDDWATGHPKKSVVADVDGDGLDEIVNTVFYFNTDEIALRIVDYNNGESPVAKEVTRIDAPCDVSDILTGSAGGGSDWEDGYFRQDLAAGDIDGDGKDEIIVVIGLHVLIFDDYTTSFKSLTNITLPDINPTSKSYVRVACGDFDMDGIDEVVFADGEASADNIANYYIYDDIHNYKNFDHIIKSGPIQDTDGATISLRAADVAVGDFDGDGIPEIVFAGQRYQSSLLSTMVLDVSMDSSSKPQFAFLGSVKSDNYEHGGQYYLTGVATGDIDGDGKDDIACYDDIYTVKDGVLGYNAIWGNEALDIGPDYDTQNYVLADTIHIGDVNGDKKGDVVYITYDNDQIYIYTVKSDGTLDLKTDFGIGKTSNVDTVCLPNVDKDSAVVEFKGHELLFTDPRIIAVLASPPCFSGINDSGANGGTSFGYIEGHGTEKTISHGFSVGASIGTSFTAPFGLGEAEAKVTVEQSFNWGTATTHEITENWGYSTAIGEDKVVFTAIPFDVYYYKILSSPDSSQIGSTITVNVPRKPGKYHQETSYYNNHVYGNAIKIDSSIMQHTIGNPFSYANEAEKESLRTKYGNVGLFSTHYLQVGVGGGSSKISLEDLNSETSTYDYSLDVTVSMEAKTEGLVIGGSAGYQYGYSYSSTVSTGTYIEGEVPDIPTLDYNSDKAFKWGLLSYPMTQNGQKFTIVTYWVQGMN